MRNAALWISPHVKDEMIVDTADIDFEQRESWWGRDTPPADTVLVVVHPRRYEDLRDVAAGARVLRFSDDDFNGREVAAMLVTLHCRRGSRTQDTSSVDMVTWVAGGEMITPKMHYRLGLVAVVVAGLSGGLALGAAIAGHGVIAATLTINAATLSAVGAASLRRIRVIDR